MPTWTHERVDPTDQKLLDAIYQLGIECQLPAEMGCTPIPWPAMSRIRLFAESSQGLYVVYADGTELRAAVSFLPGGEIVFCISKPYRTVAELSVPGTHAHPNGIEQTKYLFGLVRDMCGEVKTFNQSEATAVLEVFQESKVVRLAMSSDGVPTGAEKVVE